MAVVLFWAFFFAVCLFNIQIHSIKIHVASFVYFVWLCHFKLSCYTWCCRCFLYGCGLGTPHAGNWHGNVRQQVIMSVDGIRKEKNRIWVNLWKKIWINGVCWCGKLLITDFLVILLCIYVIWAVRKATFWAFMETLIQRTQGLLRSCSEMFLIELLEQSVDNCEFLL